MKYRTEIRDRTVPHTIDGDTRMVTEPYTVQVPIPPRDWDRIVLSGVTTATIAVVAASVVWSTTSIGSLLSRSVPAPVAYLAAAAFDLAWITCMAVEWLARYDTRKAALPRIAGWIALALAMAAVGIEGSLTGSGWVGLVGALVSALAKGMWTVTMRHTAKPLDNRSRQWVEQQTAEAGARLALAAVRRQVARADAQYNAEAAALALSAPPALPAPEPETGQPDTVSATVRSAVRAARSTMPGAAPADIAATLTGLGIPVTPDTVRQLSGQDADTTDSSSGQVLHLAAQPEMTIADTVRTVLASGVRDPDKVLSAVRAVHGQHVAKDTVDRTLRRIRDSHAS